MNGRLRMRITAKVAVVLVALMLAAVPLTAAATGSTPQESRVVHADGPYPPAAHVFCGTCVYIPTDIEG